MTEQQKFKVLADQIKISNQLDAKILNSGELTRIDVSNKNRTWEFHITLPQFLAHEDYLLFINAIEQEFKDIANVTCRFTVTNGTNQDEHAIKYFGHCIDQTALSPKVKGQLKQKKLIMSGKVLKVMVSNDIERNHFDKACNGSLIKAFRNCGFDIDKIIFETNDNDQEQNLASLEAHIQEEDEQSARLATEKLEKMKAEKAKQQDNNESAVDKCQIGKPIQIENIKPIES
ncbi:PolC-type DNA polymerase III N-terminal domain-containing protein, partial [Staphylococcus aureus]|nr:PolC-type DNA polymerase III N-terminal domain-containing protein [Staphylococcus aureus]